MPLIDPTYSRLEYFLMINVTFLLVDGLQIIKTELGTQNSKINNIGVFNFLKIIQLCT